MYALCSVSTQVSTHIAGILKSHMTPMMAHSRVSTLRKVNKPELASQDWGECNLSVLMIVLHNSKHLRASMKLWVRQKLSPPPSSARV